MKVCHINLKGDNICVYSFSCCPEVAAKSIVAGLRSEKSLYSIVSFHILYQLPALHLIYKMYKTFGWRSDVYFSPKFSLIYYEIFGNWSLLEFKIKAALWRFPANKQCFSVFLTKTYCAYPWQTRWMHFLLHETSAKAAFLNILFIVGALMPPTADQGNILKPATGCKLRRLCVCLLIKTWHY